MLDCQYMIGYQVIVWRPVTKEELPRVYSTVFQHMCVPLRGAVFERREHDVLFQQFITFVGHAMQ